MTTTGKTLSQLGLPVQGGADVTVTGLAIDSRKVGRGTLFAALPGTRVHGAAFIAKALADGAAAILTDREGAALAADVLGESEAAVIVAEDARATLAHAAALWFGPGPETLVAVTGTNGKTSVASFTRQIWELLGHRAVNIGTTGVEGSFSATGVHTTPDALTLQSLLARIRADGIERVAMEASSHGLDQRRMEAVEPCAVAFTNLTQDHLDYHGTMEAYFEAKLRLFTELLPEDGVAVVNVDDPYGQRVADIVEAHGSEVIGIAQYAEAAELKIAGRRLDERGQDLLVQAWGRPVRLRLPLIGAFQAMNVLTAAGLAIAAGEEPDAVFGVLPRLTGVRGADAACRRPGERGAGLCRLRAHPRRAGERAEGAEAPRARPSPRRLRRGRRPGPGQAPAHGAGGGGPCGRGDRDRRQPALRGSRRDPGRDPRGLPGGDGSG
jgi:UDP-N-acetylmuramoyl-L-alanyl-D-glutamate--2,6-diaminopimelate ligase